MWALRKGDILSPSRGLRAKFRPLEGSLIAERIQGALLTRSSIWIVLCSELGDDFLELQTLHEEFHLQLRKFGPNDLQSLDLVSEIFAISF